MRDLFGATENDGGGGVAAILGGHRLLTTQGSRFWFGFGGKNNVTTWLQLTTAIAMIPSFVTVTTAHVLFLLIIISVFYLEWYYEIVLNSIVNLYFSP